MAKVKPLYVDDTPRRRLEIFSNGDGTFRLTRTVGSGFNVSSRSADFTVDKKKKRFVSSGPFQLPRHPKALAVSFCRRYSFALT